MAWPATNPRIVQFGLFELDLDARELRKSGVRIKLQEQPFQILAMLLERPGEIVTREELQRRLWPQDTFVDFDLSLNSAVKKLRQALGDDSENPRFIETLYRRGYRFIGNTNDAMVERLPSARPASPEPAVSGVLTQKATKLHRRLLAGMIAVLVIGLALLTLFIWPSAPPRVIGYTQITHDGLFKGGILTDGERLYFTEERGDHVEIAQVSAAGGETSALAMPFQNTVLADIAADGSALLVGDFEGIPKILRLWSAPLPTGSPQRLGDLSGTGAAWSSDRNEIVVANGSDIFASTGNGSQARKLATINGSAFWLPGLRFSPDGRRIRFTVTDDRTGSSALWEMNRDGSGLHPLLPGWNQAPRECCGAWTADGKYYVFQSLRNGKTNLWLWDERMPWFGRQAKPLQLTNGPLNFSSPLASKDGKTIFAVGAQPRSEVVRYDGRSGFVPILGGISATDVAFSVDDQWMAYVAIPEGTLWRSRADGTQRLQLTAPPLVAALPRWSPDGKQIVFMGQSTNARWRAFLIPSDGGAARDLLPSAEAGFDPGWSPDGKSVVLTLNEAGDPGVRISGPGIAILDLQTRKISTLPGAAQFFSPRWSPDGRYIAVITGDSWKLVLFDRETQHWTQLASTPTGYPSWSHDGKYLYFDTTFANDPAFFRVRISDHKLERLASLKGLQRYEGQFGSWAGLGPDDSLLLTRDTGSQEIYALDWKAP